MNKSEVLRYMGYRGTQPDPATEAMLQEMMALTESVSRPAFTFQVLPIRVEADKVKLGEQAELLGTSIAKHLSGCTSCALMAATLGLTLDHKIVELEKTDPTRALILDYCGSAYIEDVCDQVQEEIVRKVEAQQHTNRFSPGYGDLPLATQALFQTILLMDKRIGVTLTPDFLMIPRKSVTAIIGFGSAGEQKNKCESCAMDCAGRE